MSGEIAETSFTDLFTLPKLGRVYTNVWTRPCLKGGRVLTQRPGGNWRLLPNTHQPMQNSLPAGQQSPIDRPGAGHGGLAPWICQCKLAK